MKKRMVKINRKKQRLTFQYDPQSYALNFDDGIGIHQQRQLQNQAAEICAEVKIVFDLLCSLAEK